MDYVKTGRVSDTTPPPTPYNVKVVDMGERGGAEITWDADADFESGILNFIIMKDGQELSRLPVVNQVRSKVLPMFQAGWMNSHGDAPANPSPAMRFVDPFPKDGQKYSYSIIEVNTAGLQSAPSAPVAVPVAASANRANPGAAAATRPAAAPGEIIIDNSDPGSHTEGNWARATGDHDYRDDVVWAANTAAADAPSTATWTSEIKTAGTYDVYEWHGDDPNNDHATSAPFTIAYDGGTKTIPINLRATPGAGTSLARSNSSPARPAASPSPAEPTATSSLMRSGSSPTSSRHDADQKTRCNCKVHVASVRSRRATAELVLQAAVSLDRYPG